jgi:hypothetical protein
VSGPRARRLSSVNQFPAFRAGYHALACGDWSDVVALPISVYGDEERLLPLPIEHSMRPRTTTFAREAAAEQAGYRKAKHCQ